MGKFLGLRRVVDTVATRVRGAQALYFGYLTGNVFIVWYLELLSAGFMLNLCISNGSLKRTAIRPDTVDCSLSAWNYVADTTSVGGVLCQFKAAVQEEDLSL